MARISEHNITPILDAAEQWKNTCFANSGSVFDEEPIWTDALLGEFEEHFVKNPDFGEGDFFTKWEKQVKAGSRPLSKLTAEILWLYYLFPSNVMHKTKVDQIRRVYGWSGDVLDLKHPMLEALQAGVGSAGMGYNLRRPEEIEYLYNVIVAFRKLDPDEQKTLLKEPWDFSNWLDSTSGSIDDPNRIFRHILVFLLFPSEMERIASKNHKVRIVQRWKDLTKDAPIKDDDSELVALDKRILAIREKLEEDAQGQPVDFYYDVWYPEWDPRAAKKSEVVDEDRAGYGALHPLMQRFITIMPDFLDFENPGKKFKENELEYKQELLEDFQTQQSAIEAKLDKGDALGVIEDFKRLIGKTNLVNWRGWDQMFGKPVNETASLEVLRKIRELSQEAYSKDKLEPIFETLKKHDLRPGWTLPTVLLWLWNPEEYYPIKSRYIREYAIQFGRKLKMAAPSSEHLDIYMQLGYDTRKMLARWKPRDWIDVQSFMWVIGGWEDQELKLASPFDTLFENLEESTLLLDLMEKGLTGLGLDGDGESDPRLAMTLPYRSGKRKVLRVNFGAWVAMSILRYKDGQRYFQFSCKEHLVPKGSLDNELEKDKPENELKDVFIDSEGNRYPVIRVPASVYAEKDISESVIESMKGLGKHFSEWKGTPYRPHHIPLLYGLFFDVDMREELLPTGFDPSSQDEDEVIEVVTKNETDEEALASYTRANALDELFIDAATYDRMATLLRRKKNLILQGPPGVGKSFLAKKLAYSIMGEKDKKRVTMIQFHQSYAYEDFIQGFRPNGGDGASFEKRNGVFYRFCKKAEKNPDQDYYFIIDEINRGNLSRIFGELMLLIEPDKRGEEHALPLTYTPEYNFYVPENVHIIGMMNTADRSLAMVDYALRRRFAFMDLKPAFDSPKFAAHLIAQGITSGKVTQIRHLMCALNQQITASSRDLGAGYCIGHSFFCATKPVEDVDQWYREIIETEIQPLLEEYWADTDNGKVETEVGKLLNGE